MLNRPIIWSNRSKESRVGLLLGRRGFSACALIDDKLIRASEQTSSQAAAGHALARWVRAQGLEGACTAIVLNQNDYAFQLIDQPAVAQEELSDATLWAINQRIENPINGGEVEWFREPVSADGSHPNRLYAAACPRSTLESLARQISDANLNLTSIRIEETLPCAQPNSSNKVQAILRGSAEGALFTLTVDQAFYVSRRIPLPSAESRAPERAITDAKQSIEGCLEYFHRRFGMPRPLDIHFSTHPDTATAQQALQALMDNLNWQSETVGVANTNTPVDPEGLGVSAAVLAAVTLATGETK